MNVRTNKGTNQHRARYRVYGLKAGTWFSIAIVVLFIAGVIQVSLFLKEHEPVTLISPIAYRAHAMELEQAIPVEASTPEQQQIRDYIIEVFGADSDKAFALLGCENAKLNPKAVNTAGNSPAGSRDIGVFQINEYWQQVNGRFLFDWKINVQIAYKIYVDNGRSFERWTCGRKLGI